MAKSTSNSFEQREHAQIQQKWELRRLIWSCSEHQNVFRQQRCFQGNNFDFWFVKTSKAFSWCVRWCACFVPRRDLVDWFLCDLWFCWTKKQTVLCLVCDQEWQQHLLGPQFKSTEKDPNMQTDFCQTTADFKQEIAFPWFTQCSSCQEGDAPKWYKTWLEYHKETALFPLTE